MELSSLFINEETKHYFFVISKDLFKPQQQKVMIHRLAVQTGLLVVLTRGGELYSLSRFVYCIPAFPFAMAVLFRESLIPRKALIGILFFFPWLFGIHVHIQAALTASLLSAIVAGSILFWSSNTTWKSALVIAMLAVLQAYCCSLFLQGHWLG